MKATQPNKSLSPEQQFSGLLKQAPLSLLVLKGNNLVIEFVNDMYLAIVDKKEEALLGRPILEAKHSSANKCLQPLPVLADR
jgi:hypothetical protein